MATLREAIAVIQADMLTLTGMRGAPTDPPEAPQVFPFSICLPESGEWESQADAKRGLQTVTVDIHVARRELPKDVAALTTYFADAVPNKLLNDITLGGTVDTIVAPIRWQLLTFRWDQSGNVQTIGMRFYVTFKQRSAIT